jgi:hypothetical protein
MSAGLDQRFDGRQRSCSHGSVQGRYAGPIRRIGIGADRREVLNHVGLRRRVPPIGICGVMKWFRSASIPRLAIGSMRNQEFCNRAPKCRGRHVESRIAAIEVVSDLDEEKGRRQLPRRALVGRRSGKTRIAGQAAG